MIRDLFSVLRRAGAPRPVGSPPGPAALLALGALVSAPTAGVAQIPELPDGVDQAIVGVEIYRFVGDLAMCGLVVFWTQAGW